jgi:cbb3-type cytochrome oxidase subunit 3
MSCNVLREEVAMRINPKALGITLGLAWAAGVFLAGIAHLLWPAYGGAFLEAVASIYPGYHVGGFEEVIVGTLYALLDGAVGGVVVAWLYNTAAKAEVTR